MPRLAQVERPLRSPPLAPARSSRTAQFQINTAESFFALLKRGVVGAFHHVSVDHLQRYSDEFEFRWNTRMLTDAQRTRMALAQGDGVRLTYRPTAS